MFNETQLQVFWQIKATALSGLTSVCGKSILILSSGQINRNQGADFLNAHIKIGHVAWVGNVEIHRRTSDWYFHAHDKDDNYKNIILHVVWVNDLEEFRDSAVLELSKFVDKDEFSFLDTIIPTHRVNCSSQRSFPINVSSTQDLLALGFNRILRKKELFLRLLELDKFDYAKTLWRAVFRGFGRVANADAFETLFSSIPIHVIRLYAYDLRLLTSLLMGQAGLLEPHYKDDYPLNLFFQYFILKERHALNKMHNAMKWLRMRPRNFPTIRVAQLATFYHHHISLVHQLLACEKLDELFGLFDLELEMYWDNHYLFDKKSKPHKKEIGFVLRSQIIINVFIPFLLAYAQLNKKSHYDQKALGWLNELKPEKNSIIDTFSSLGFKSNSAVDTQALHELYEKFCLENFCKSCVRGRSININYSPIKINPHF